MEAYLIKSRTFFLQNPLMDTFHAGMFHGIETKRRDNAGRPQIELAVNRYVIRSVIHPTIELLVNDSISRKLREIGVESYSVKTNKVFEIPYQAGDFSHWDGGEYSDDGEGPERIIDAAPDVRRSGIIPTYNIVVEPLELNPDEAMRLVQSGQQLICYTHFNHNFFAAYPSILSNELEGAWRGGGHIVSPEVFGILKEHLLQPYFLCARIGDD